MNDYNMLQKAISIAVKAHDRQVRFNGEPFILHPIRVMLSMDTVVGKIVAILHDVLEDTDVTVNDLYDAGLYPSITDVILAVTHRKDESYKKYISRTLMYKTAIKVKLADLRDNLKILDLPCMEARDTKRIKKHYDAYKFLMEKIK